MSRKVTDNITFRFVDKAYIRIISEEQSSSLIISSFGADFCRCPFRPLLLLFRNLGILITYKGSSSGEETGRPHLLSVQS